MTNKAIKFFETEIRSLELAPELNVCDMTEEWQEQMEIFKAAKEALEKQIPKKLIKISEYYRVETDEWIADYKCAGCGNPYADDSYCSCCGQKLDWSDTE